MYHVKLRYKFLCELEQCSITYEEVLWLMFSLDGCLEYVSAQMEDYLVEMIGLLEINIYSETIFE